MEPPSIAPYRTLVCVDKSSTLVIGSFSKASVIEAESCAMYVWHTITAKNHHIEQTQRVPIALQTEDSFNKTFIIFALFLLLSIWQLVFCPWKGRYKGNSGSYFVKHISKLSFVRSCKLSYKLFHDIYTSVRCRILDT